MYRLAPGSILTDFKIERRLKASKIKTFLEVGAGDGFVSNIFLQNGCDGSGIDFNERALESNAELNRNFIETK